MERVYGNSIEQRRDSRRIDVTLCFPYTAVGCWFRFDAALDVVVSAGGRLEGAVSSVG